MCVSLENEDKKDFGSRNWILVSLTVLQACLAWLGCNPSFLKVLLLNLLTWILSQCLQFLVTDTVFILKQILHFLCTKFQGLDIILSLGNIFQICFKLITCCWTIRFSALSHTKSSDDSSGSWPPAMWWCSMGLWQPWFDLGCSEMAKYP